MIPQTVEYALRAMVYLATRPDVPSSAKEIAKSTQVPLSYLQKILQQLRKALFVTSVRGIEGGYRLAKPSSKISVLEIVNLIDPIQPLGQCPLAHGKSITIPLCPLHKMLRRVLLNIEKEFGSMTIHGLVRQGKGCRKLESFDASN